MCEIISLDLQREMLDHIEDCPHSGRCVTCEVYGEMIDDLLLIHADAEQRKYGNGADLTP